MSTTNSFRNEDILTFFNKALETLRVVPRATSVMAYAPGASSIQLEGSGVQFSAAISDFGMGDIGLSAITVRNGERSKTIEIDNSPRLIPALSDYLAYEGGVSGHSQALNKAVFIASTVDEDLKMSDTAKVLINGKAMTLAQYVIDRPRPTKEAPAVSISI